MGRQARQARCKQIGRSVDRQAGRQIGGQVGRQVNRQIDRQRGREVEREGERRTANKILPYSQPLTRIPFPCFAIPLLQREVVVPLQFPNGSDPGEAKVLSAHLEILALEQYRTRSLSRPTGSAMESGSSPTRLEFTGVGFHQQNYAEEVKASRGQLMVNGQGSSRLLHGSEMGHQPAKLLMFNNYLSQWSN